MTHLVGWLVGIFAAVFVLSGCTSFQIDPQIPLNGKMIKTEAENFTVGQYKMRVTTTTLEGGITIQNLDYGSDGSIEGMIVRQEFPDGRSVQELYKGYPGAVISRMMLVKSDASIIVFEELCTDGSVEKTQHTTNSDGSLKIETISKTKCSPEITR